VVDDIMKGRSIFRRNGLSPSSLIIAFFVPTIADPPEIRTASQSSTVKAP
jgi:hypothetical protein